MQFYYGSGNTIVVNDGKEIPTIVIGGEKQMNSLTKLMTFMTTDRQTLLAESYTASWASLGGDPAKNPRVVITTDAFVKTVLCSRLTSFPRFGSSARWKLISACSPLRKLTRIRKIIIPT